MTVTSDWNDFKILFIGLLFIPLIFIFGIPIFLSTYGIAWYWIFLGTLLNIGIVVAIFVKFEIFDYVTDGFKHFFQIS